MNSCPPLPRAARALVRVVACACALVVAPPLAPAAAQQRWYETDRLRPDFGIADQRFGAAVALSGTTALVGAPGAPGPVPGSFGAGSARVFRLVGHAWIGEAELDTPAPFSIAHFGDAVALHADTALVGLPALNHSGQPSQGAVAVFVRQGGAWALEDLLFAPDIQSAAQSFGAAVAVHGNALAIGAPGADEGTQAGAGAAYVYVRSAGQWTQQARLVSPDPQQLAAFGSDLDLERDTLLVGEPYTTPQLSLISAGAGQVYTRSGTAWTFQATLTSLDQGAYDYSGLVALSGDRAVLGSPGALGPGELTTFLRTGGTWTQDTLFFDHALNGLGRAVDFDGLTLVTGTRAFIAAGQRPGAVIWDGEPIGWVQGPVAWARDGLTGGESAYPTPSVALEGDLLLVGSPFHDEAATDAGIVHVFTRDGPWADLQYALEGSVFKPPLMFAAGSLTSPSGNVLLLGGQPGGGFAWLIASLQILPQPFKGGVMVPAPSFVFGPIGLPQAFAEATTQPLPIPAGVPPGVTVYVQAWLPDPGGPAGFAATNALSATVR